MAERDTPAGNPNERPESAYEDRATPQPPEPPHSDPEYRGFSRPATGRSAISPVSGSESDPASDRNGRTGRDSESAREGGGAPSERD